MSKRTTFAVLAGLLAATLLPAGCRDAVSPERHGPGAPQFDAAAPGVVFDQGGGALGETGTALGSGFSPTNPHHGDAIVATFVWRGSTNIITSVTDRLADGTPVGNTYTLVEYVQGAGISMATYVATDVGNFPDPSSDWSDVLEVRARLSASVTDGGVLLSAYTGVNAVSAQAVGAHRSAIGSGSSPTTAGPGAIPVNAGALAYAVTLSNDGVAGLARPQGFTTVTMMADAAMGIEADYAAAAGAGSVDPRWTWFFDSPGSPRTWLGTVLALNPAAAPQPAVATRLAFTVQPSSTPPGTTIAPAVKVAALDDAGNTVSSFTGSITVRTNPGPGTLSGTTTVAAVAGVASFSDLSIDQAAYAHVLYATAPDLTGATSTAFDVAAPAGPAPAAAGDPITLDQVGGTTGESGMQIIKGFNPTNPHHGDAIIATFFWVGSTNIIESVTDHIAEPGFPLVGNTYTLVEYVQAGGVSMATYVATNVQNYPDPNPPNQQVLAVRANLSQPITSGGVLLSSFTGVDPDFTRAFTGAKSSASGSGSSPTIAHPGAIALNANAMAYGVSMTNVPVTVGPPPDFTHIAAQSDGVTMATDGVYTVRTSAGPVDPQWTWFFDQLHPGTWLATVLALNPEPLPPGTLRVTTSTTGSSLDPDGYTVTVNGQSQTIATNNSTGITFTLAAGSYSVALSGVAANCTVTSANPQQVSVPSGGTVTAAFTVSCSTPPGTLRVTTSTTGSSLDPDGYTVTVNGQSQAIATNNSTGITFTLAAGSYSVALSGVAANCTVTSANPQQVSVPSGGTVTAAFTVSCTTPQARAQVSGGGRIDPSSGKTTFGFNVDGRSGSSFQGETEVVYHGGTSRMTRIHSSFIDGMTTSSDSRGGLCVTWTGSARVDNGAQRRFTATACDNGQPNGSAGPDRFGITVDGTISIGLTDLKGGNTQARQ